MDPDLDEIEGLGDLGVLPSEVIINVISKSHLLDALSICNVSRSMRSHASHSATGLVCFLLYHLLYLFSSYKTQITDVYL